MEILVTTVPHSEAKDRVHKLAAEDPESVYYSVSLPLGDPLRAAGQVRIFKCERPARTREIDKRLHRLVRRR